KAVLAFHRTGDTVSKEEVWKLLAAKVGSTLRLGDRMVSLTELQGELDAKYKGPLAESNLYDWGLYRGNASRTAQGSGGAPFLEKRYARPTVGASTNQSTGGYEDSPTAQTHVATAVKMLEQREQPVLPALFPIAADGKLVYRSFWGLHAIDIKSGKLLWEAGSKLS